MYFIDYLFLVQYFSCYAISAFVRILVVHDTLRLALIFAFVEI